MPTIFKTKKENLFGNKVNLPIVGKVEVSKEGTIEVEDEQLVKILEEQSAALGWKKVLPVNEESEIESNEGGDEEIEDLDKTLEAMTMADLKEFASQSGISEEDIAKFSKNKKAFITFLKKKIPTVKDENSGDNDKD